MMTKHAWTIRPTTSSGKRSVWLIIAMLTLFTLGKLLLSEGTTVFTVTMLAVMAAGISAFITGVSAMLRQRDKALLVLISTLIGALLIWILVDAIIEDIF